MVLVQGTTIYKELASTSSQKPTMSPQTKEEEVPRSLLQNLLG